MQQLQEIFLQANNTTSLDGPTRSVLKVISAGLETTGANTDISSLLDRLGALRPQDLDGVIHKGRKALWPNKAPLRDGSLRNYRSVLASMAVYAAETTGRGEARPLRALLEGTGKGHKHRQHVDPSNLSEAALDDIERYVAFKTARILPPRELKLRGGTWRPITANLVVSRLRSHWARTEEMLGRESTRVERFSPETYSKVIEDYLSEGERMYQDGTKSFPGYTLAKQIAIHLQIGCREYLAAYHPEDLEEISTMCGGDVDEVYNKYREDMDKRHATTKRGKHKTDTTQLTRSDLRKAGLRALEEAERIREQHGSKKKWMETELRYRRGGLLLAMLSSWAMRLRNAAEMQWGHNIEQERNGNWSFSFSGEELKIPVRGREVNVYEGTFPPSISELISDWRDHLESVYDPEITHVVPYVLPTNDDLRNGLWELQKRRGEAPPLDPLIAHADSLLEIGTERLQAAAVQAAEARNLDELWRLTAAYAYLKDGGRPPARKMLLRDNLTLREVLESKVFEPLLNPPPGALQAFTGYYESKGRSVETIRTKHIGARHLFRALRWAGATEANPYSGYPEKPRTGHYVTTRLSAKDVLRDDFVALFNDVMGIRITPHRARNILSGDAKRFGQLTGNDAWALASKRLGNHPMTVFHEYNELDISASEAFDDAVDENDNHGAFKRSNVQRLVSSLSAEERQELLKALEE